MDSTTQVLRHAILVHNSHDEWLVCSFRTDLNLRLESFQDPFWKHLNDRLYHNRKAISIFVLLYIAHPVAFLPSYVTHPSCILLSCSSSSMPKECPLALTQTRQSSLCTLEKIMTFYWHDHSYFTFCVQTVPLNLSLQQKYHIN